MGAPTDGTSADGVTPLMHATQWGHYQVVALLLDKGADCQVYSSEGWTSLHYAVHGLGGGGLIHLLIERGIGVDIPTDTHASRGPHRPAGGRSTPNFSDIPLSHDMQRLVE